MGNLNLRELWYERSAPNCCTYLGPLSIVPLPGFSQHFSLALCVVLRGEHFLISILFLGGEGQPKALSKGT